MVVQATPIGTPTIADLTDPSRFNVHTPVIDTLYEESLLLKKRATKIRQGAKSTIHFQMYGSDGNPLDLTGLGLSDSLSMSSSSSASLPATIKTRFREASLVDTTIVETDEITVTDADNGIIQVDIPSEIYTVTGIYFADFGIFDSAEDLIGTNEIYLFVEHSAWHGGSTLSGPPTIDDVRLALRDNDPYESELLDHYGYPLVEILHAAVRTIHFWNDQPPVIAIARHSTKNFPWREIWMQGIRLNLFRMIEEHYRRNFLPHRGGGSIKDDKNRHKEYNQAWKEAMGQFKDQVTHQKAQINMQQGYMMHTSRYPLGRIRGV